MIKILMVDDDYDDFSQVRHLLKSAQHRVYHIDWADSIEKAEQMQFIDGYHLLLVDHYLSNNEFGIELVRRMETKGDRTPCILLSGHESITLTPEALQLISRQQVGFLNKNNLDEELLVRVIAEHAAHAVRVLVVDDSIEDFEEVRCTLESIPQYRFQVEWSSSFDDAEKHIIGQPYDLFVVSYRLPAENLLREVSKVVELAPHQPVILLSQDNRLEPDDHVMRLIGRGNIGFLSKERLSTDSLGNLITFAMLRRRAKV